MSWPLLSYTDYYQSSAEAALGLHGYELEPGRNLQVYISDPERKKERTDADANSRELYIAGLAKSVRKEDLEKLFKTVSEERRDILRSMRKLTVPFSMEPSRMFGWVWTRRANRKVSPS